MSRCESPVVMNDGPAEPVARRGGLYSFVLLCGGHFAVDLYSGALGALQPLLIKQHHTSLTQAGILGGLLVFSSSVMQPVYGYLSDRIHSRHFTVLAPAVAGIFISSLGIAPSYLWLMLLVLLGGAGVAAFHPQASSRVALGLEEGRARFMAVFISFGTLGAALGPTYFSAITGSLGLPGSYWAAAPGLLMTLLLFFFLRPVPATPAHVRRHVDWKPLVAVWRPLALLFALVFIRSILQIVFAQFLPLYLHMSRGYAVAHANYATTAYLIAGAIGGFFGGHVADRFGGRTAILFSMVASAPSMALFFFGEGVWSLAGLIAGGFTLLFTMPVNVVLAQELAPSQTGTVSALMMGFGWGSAGMVFIPLVGYAADLLTLHSVLASLTIFPLIGALLALKLPK